MKFINTGYSTEFFSSFINLMIKFRVAKGIRYPISPDRKLEIKYLPLSEYGQRA